MSEIRQWNISSVLDPKAPRNTPYALILLNTPISEKHAIVFYRVWQQAAIRIVADGAANMLLEFMDAHKDKLFKMPDLICGDLDSISDHARSYFEERHVHIQRLASQYSTDLQKSIQHLELEEDTSSLQYDLVIFGGLTGRLDQTMHTLHVLWQLAPGVPVDDIITSHDTSTDENKDGRLRKRPHTVVLSDTCATCLLGPGKHVLQHNRSIVGKSCGILPLGVSSACIQSEGLEWNLESQKSSLGGFLSTSNHLAPDNLSGTVLIETDSPVYWTVELQVDTELL
ncbi:Similar to S.cerevisiae protein THI80 (Thiamine pyrophosphokinase) [Malassezia sympodialis ATCC 42132]|uniref:Thiamine pyrophosphokinase n=1 Tax=Malassezia sympodialis (strain ATCC 42132) TaxID=1230383 RepID=A0A1M8AB46_MALS4|nr:Similar to S.cerevisiae protein THI80 (Thiamine pyrophosphokinase) [Malassezia sympodialis ATCC 42132]